MDAESVGYGMAVCAGDDGWILKWDVAWLCVQTWVYYVAIVLDLLLRFLWTVSLLPGRSAYAIAPHTGDALR